MLDKGLDTIVSKYGRGFSEWDYSREFQCFRNRDHKVPLRLIIKCDKYVGNFERELIGYAFGILDGVQMNIDFAREERLCFAKEVYGRDTVIDPEEEEYELLDEYLFESFCPADDWEQITFYGIVPNYHDKSSAIQIQFAKMPPVKWTCIFVPRIKQFFEKYATTTAKGAKITDMYFEVVATKERFSLL